MSLVKTSKITGANAAARSKPEAAPAVKRPRQAPRPRRAVGGGTRQEQAAERVAAATEQLASGLTEAGAAAEELRGAMEQIAAGADEAAGASQEQLAAIRSMLINLTAARREAETCGRRTDTVQIALAETAVQISASVGAIEKSAARQKASVTVIAELARRAQDIGDISATVSRISDQTNLLALNAAIEAARAGDHGRGFAVVAEEVRALAETSEKSAQDVQSLAATIQNDVRGIVQAIEAAADTAVNEARAGAAAVEALGAMRQDMERIAGGSQEILTASVQAEVAASEAQRGAEQVAVAAEEQSSAASEAQSAIGEQARSLDQGQIAAEALAGLTEDLRAGRTDASSAEQIGATAEELSATIQELSSAAAEIMAAVEQINRGSQLQAGATQQTSAAMAQIEKSAGVAETNATTAKSRVQDMGALLLDSRKAVEGLVQGVTQALADTRASLDMITGLESVGRHIDKIVDGIALVTVQTGMLAVSGAVEAARAGDSGRGFAVVSNDIRSLAREASESADRVKDTVRGITDQIGQVRRELEQIIVAAEGEMEKNQAVIVALGRLDTEMAALVQANDAILGGAAAILLAARETLAGARQIASAAEEASAASRQAASASSEQARSAEDLAAAIEEIASLADELKQSND